MLMAACKSLLGGQYQAESSRAVGLLEQEALGNRNYNAISFRDLRF